ncbi:hypothetical protein NQ318_002668 [Aromia moschata]|uniref:cystathionine gamma-lyase n=1 Tax=Aromia moschata TaxID=1265417 RepID=A0AAV8XUY4_9CUCU|nr:hypothetical protein NQ318_002668 [Aromia moschata]
MGEKEGFLPFSKGFETLCAHHSQEPKQWNSKSIVPHIVTSTVFEVPDPTHRTGYLYGRRDNPSRSILQNVLAAINKARFSLCYASGASAIVAVLSLLKTGEHMICCNEVSKETYEIFDTIAKTYRICSTFTDFNDLSNVCEAIQKNTKLIWAENPTDPTLNIIDICGLANIAKDKNILLAVNNTFLTPYLQRPLELGADIVMQSVTKYMNGHSDIVMGNLCINKEDLRERLDVPQYARALRAGVVRSHHSFFESRYSDPVQEKMQRSLEQRMAIKFCVKLEKSAAETIPMLKKTFGVDCLSNRQIFRWHKAFAEGREDVNDEDRAGRPSTSSSDDNVKRVRDLLNTDRRLNVRLISETLDITKTIVHEIVYIMSHSYMTNEQKVALNITANLIRISIGLEHICDLILDIEQALDRLRKK